MTKNSVKILFAKKKYGYDCLVDLYLYHRIITLYKESIKENNCFFNIINNFSTHMNLKREPFNNDVINLFARTSGRIILLKQNIRVIIKV